MVIADLKLVIEESGAVITRNPLLVVLADFMNGIGIERKYQDSAN
jgi:hypothetical protein